MYGTDFEMKTKTATVRTTFSEIKSKKNKMVFIIHTKHLLSV